jgi:hypothetical protein
MMALRPPSLGFLETQPKYTAGITLMYESDRIRSQVNEAITLKGFPQ